ncbi:MAG: hypothetical protein PHF79_02795 [Candidatus Pacebacteria bacterium]|nr:hypothetical protein [Candidatus Paceibacterota bacterium]
MNNEQISFDDFKKVKIAVGQILTAEKVPETDKLLRLTVDFAEANPRQVVSGISLHFPDPISLIGKKYCFVINLEPRTIRGLESQAMILAASTEEAFTLIGPLEEVPAGVILK